MTRTLAFERTDTERAGGAWDYVSPSRLSLWVRCPLAWRFKYLDGIRTPTTPSLFVGKMVHHGMEVHYRHRQLGVVLPAAEIVRAVNQYWPQAAVEEAVQFADVVAEDKARSQAVQLVEAYLEQLPADEPRPMAVEATMEAPLVDPATGENFGIPMLGIVDLVLASGDGPTIVDFKTSSRSAPTFEITHEIQLSSYAYLFRAVTGESEGGLEIRSLVKTKQPKIETQRYSARSELHLRRLFALIREYLDALDSGRFNYRPGWACGMCDFRDSHCCRWTG